MNIELPWSEAVWTQFWQLSLAIVVVGALTKSLFRRQPQVSYALWMVVLVKAMTPPVWTSNLSAFGWLGEPEPPVWLAAEESNDVEPRAEGDGTAAGRQAVGASSADRGTAENLPAGHAAPTLHVNDVSAARVRPWVVLWIVGGVAIASGAVAASVRRRRLLAAAGRLPSDALSVLVAELARNLGLHGPPRVVVSNSGLGPAVCGVVTPTLVLPRCIADGGASDTLRAVLTHELIHLRRRDHLATGAQAVVQAVWWFDPLVWWANRQICRIRESCCDAETVQALGQPPRRYARALVDVLEAKRRVRPAWGIPGVRPVDVTASRVKEILAMSNRMVVRAPLTGWAAAVAAAALLLPGGRWGLHVASAAERADSGEAETVKKPAAKPVLVLKYGDNKPDGKKSIAGAGEMIRFTMPEGQANALRALRVHSARYGYPQPPDEDVEINVLNEDMTEVVHTELVPYRLFKRQAEPRWMMIPFEDPVDVPPKFWIVLNFNAEATKGVYVSYDTSTKGEHSRVGFNDQDAKETQFGGDWMVQAMLAK
jgi:beta-lactamase regulating signal transducer with metallopeptidase domain